MLGTRLIARPFKPSGHPQTNSSYLEFHLPLNQDSSKTMSDDSEADHKREDTRSRYAPLWSDLSTNTAVVFLIVLLLIHVSLLSVVGYLDSPTYDEIQHVPAGVMHWSTSRFNFGYTNPPIPRFISTFALNFVERTENWTNITSDEPHGHWNIGKQYALANGEGYLLQVRVARFISFGFSVLVGLTCFYWASNLYQSAYAGGVAVVLWCFCPFALGHGHLATVDVAAALFGMFFLIAAWYWMQSCSWRNAVLLGFGAGLACSGKFSWILFAGSVLLLVFIVHFEQRPRAVGYLFAQSIVIAILAVWVINMGYAFDGSFATLASYREAQRLNFVPSLGNSIETWLPVPLPRYYVLGIDTLKDFVDSHPRSYMLGQWQRGGWISYYAIGLALKLTIGTLGLILLRIATRKGFTLREDFPLVAVVIVFAYLSSETGVGHHLRYALPVVPLLFVWIGGIVVDVRHRLTRYTVWTLVVMHVISSLAVFPYSLSYFNEFVGGPRAGPSYFLDSNIDWGQDLLHLRRWMQENNVDGENEMDLLYFGTMPPQLAGVTYRLGEDHRGPAKFFAVSVNYLYGMKHTVHHEHNSWLYNEFPLEALRNIQPFACAGYSIRIFSHQQVVDALRASGQFEWPR